MIATINVVISLLEKGLGLFNSSKSKLEDRQLKRLGYDLFCLYNDINELLMQGDSIVVKLRSFVNNKLTKVIIIQEINAQQKTVENILATLNEMKNIVNALDPHFYREIDNLLEVKKGYLHKIEYYLGNATIDLDATDIKTSERGNQYAPTVLQIKGALTDENRDKIVEYLDLRKPEEQLGFITEKMEKFHSIILSNFSIKDILLQVNSRNTAYNRVDGREP